MPPRLDQSLPYESPCCASRLAVTPNDRAIDHVLPVIGQAESNQRFQQSVPDTLLCPSIEPYIYRVPFSVTLMHFQRRTTDTQDIEHSVEKQTIILCRSGPTATFRRQKISNNRPFFVRQVATHSLVSAKTSLRDKGSRRIPEVRLIGRDDQDTLGTGQADIE